MKPQAVDTSRAFDQIAEDYDITYGPEGNAVMTWMRAENLGFLRQTFPPGSRLLEIGCGTGEEAVTLAREGRKIIATDISPRMARVTREKARRAGVASSVHALALPASGVGALEPTQPLDGGYASFGALNCEPRLDAVGRALTHLVRPGGCFVTSVMARTALFEMLWYLVHGRPRRAMRRVSGRWILAPVAGEGGREVTVPTRYLSARQVVRAFGAAWALEEIWALPLLFPPPYADALFRRHRSLFDRLEGWERRLRARWPWRHFGDHLVVVFRRRDRAL